MSATIKVNGEYFPLREVSKDHFAALVKLVTQKITWGEPIPQIFAQAAALIAGEKGTEEPLYHAALRALAELGVRSITIDPAQKLCTIVEESPTPAANGDASVIGFSAIESGVAYVAATVNAFRRTIRVNEEEVRLTRQTAEVGQKVMGILGQMRQVNEPIVIAAGRVAGSMMKAGKTFEDPELHMALVMLSDLGVRMVRIDVEKGILGYGPLDEGNAIAAACMQGLNAEQIGEVRKRVAEWNEKMRQKAVESGQPQPQQRTMIPSFMGVRRRR
ncbi:MAG: hypothetical protein EXS10_05945 [Phycisphaerales bacterium]|nr:hypothetical protein [Phycisphaerales bacterium]